MAQNIFERYGIKEVANVTFQALEKDEKFGYEKDDIVMYLDTLKVSTIETTAENVSAQGGKGNAKLITWDYGKDINVTLEDAVVSWEELKIMLGAQSHNASEQHKVTIHKTAQVTIETAGELPAEDVDGNTLPESMANVKYINMTKGTRPTALSADTAAIGDKIRLFWTEEIDGTDGKDAVELVISPETFPGTYRVIGDALIRSESTGADEAFQFVINKAKMLSEVTLTMQAEGDPSTFSMTLNVLRDADGHMFSLIKY